MSTAYIILPAPTTGPSGAIGVTIVQTATPSVAPTRTPLLTILLQYGSPGNVLLTSSPQIGDIVILKDDAATSATTGIWLNAVTVIPAGSANVQNQHTMVLAGNYVFGQANQDGGGSTLWLVFDGTNWVAL